VYDVVALSSPFEIRRFIAYTHVSISATTSARADDEAIRILVNELEFSKRVKTTDVMFAWLVSLQREPYEAAKTEFRKVMVELGKLGERRNEIVHSKYSMWTNTEGASGLVRENSKLKA
jgi:hypothetical protein